MSNYDYDPEADAGVGGGSHIVFDPEVRPKFPPTGDVTTTFVVLPARPLAPIPGWDVAYEAQYVKYRRYDVMPAEGKPHKFSHWIRQYYIHEWVGGESNIIAPTTYLDDKVRATSDPVRVLAEYMAGKGNLWHLFGLEPDGKKSKDKKRGEELFKAKVMPRFASKKFLMNVCMLGPDALSDCVLLSVPGGAVVNRGSADDQGNRAQWGLFDELNRKSRGVSAADIQADPSKAYFWGDITDPQGAMPVSLYKEKPPTGGLPIWVAKPADLNLRQISIANLLRRHSFVSDEKLFVEYSATRIVRELVRLFGIDHPDLLVGAFGSAYPIKRMIDDMHSGSEEEHDAGEAADEIAMTHPTTVAAGAPKSAPAAEMPAQRTYAPPASVIESKVLAYWVSVNKATPTSATLDEAKALAGASPLGVVMLMPKDQSRVWGNAQEYGFAFKQPEAPPPPPAAEAPPPPPSDPAPPPPPSSAPSAPPAVIESSLSPPPPPAATETAPVTNPGVTKEMLMAQLTGGKTSDPESAPPPPPPPAA